MAAVTRALTASGGEVKVCSSAADAHTGSVKVRSASPKSDASDRNWRNQERRLGLINDDGFWEIIWLKKFNVFSARLNYFRHRRHRRLKEPSAVAAKPAQFEKPVRNGWSARDFAGRGCYRFLYRENSEYR
jgi:hypothetical protein